MYSRGMLLQVLTHEEVLPATFGSSRKEKESNDGKVRTFTHGAVREKDDVADKRVEGAEHRSKLLSNLPSTSTSCRSRNQDLRRKSARKLCDK